MAPRKARRRRKRATVCWYLFGVIAAQLGLGALMEIAAPKLRDPEFQRKLVQLAQRQSEYPDRPLLLAMGSSRVLMGLNAKQMTQADPRWLVYNFGDLGAGPMLQQVFLRRLLTAGVRPKTLLIELVPMQMIPGDVVPLEENALETGRLSGAEMRAVSSYYRFPVTAEFRWTKARAVPTLSRHRALHDMLGADIPIGGPAVGLLDEFGFGTYEPEARQQRASAIKDGLERYAERLAGARLADGPTHAFRDLVALCRSERLQFVVLRMPETAEFRERHTPQFRADLDRFVADLRREADFPVINASDWVADDGFWDVHHLHTGGATTFSDRLAREWLAGWPFPSESVGTVTALR